MFKKLLSIVICLAMCMALLPVSLQAVETAEVITPEIPTEGDVWDGSISQPTTLAQKGGVYYYEITKCSELAYVAQTGGKWLSYNYILGNNLILNDIELTWDDSSNSIDTKNLREWTPIGTYDNMRNGSFAGIFDGAGHTISGIFIDTDESYYGLFCAASNLIRNLNVVNSVVRGDAYVGILVGHGSGSTIQNCVVSGVVVGNNCCGGVAGLGCNISNCTNLADVYGGSNVGGIVGYGSSGELTDNINYGNVTYLKGTGGDGDYFGGITGLNAQNKVLRCANFGNITAINNVGGIWGSQFVSSNKYVIAYSHNAGNVCGESNVGGIVGRCVNKETVHNCYNTGAVRGNKYIGGIVGCGDSFTLYNCYNSGYIDSNDIAGAILSSEDILWGRAGVAACFYLKNPNVIFGLGSAIENCDTEGTTACTKDELKKQETFTNWNFKKTWSIDAEINQGYPYLQWQESMLSDIPINSVQISEAALSLVEGDYAYLMATVSPSNASNQSITWYSSDDEVATVSTAGKVTAISVGTATITATTADGGYTATCIVTVTERLADEYQINSITVRDSDGKKLSAIPNEEFLATVSITNIASEGNTLVLLASYSAKGQYQGMMWVSVEDLPVGATCKVTLPVDNSDGKIENLKAFTVASFSNLTPLGDVVSFLTE